MGNRFSTDPEDIQLFIRDRPGQLRIMTSRIDPSKMEECTQLPVPMEPNVKYVFMANTDKKWHAHVYADSICDITGNDVLAGGTLGMKNTEFLKQTANTNSRYFNFTKDELGMPESPFFINNEVDPQKQENTAKSAYVKCTEMPFKATSKGITLNHNGIAAAVYTDKDCTNEYISTIPMNPNNLQYEGQRKYNQNNRDLSKNNIPLPYTNVKTFIKPSPTTNARFYRTFKTGAPPAPSDYPDYRGNAPNP